MRNPLQDQLLKAGLAKKSKVDQVVREQHRQRHAKGAARADAAADAAKVDAARLQAERAERDRQLAAGRNAQARARELQAQVRQIIETQQLPRTGEIPYGFEDGGRIRHILVDAAQRMLLARGALVIARHDGGHALLPRAAADKVRERDPGAIVLDHAAGSAADPATPASAGAAGDADDDAAFYARFQVPDDLVW